MWIRLLGIVLMASALMAAKKPKAPHGEPSALDRYIQESTAQPPAAAQTVSAGSIFYPGARLLELSRDQRASQVNDLVTVLVAEKASAVASGVTNTSRKS